MFGDSGEAWMEDRTGTSETLVARWAGAWQNGMSSNGFYVTAHSQVQINYSKAKNGRIRLVDP